MAGLDRSPQSRNTATGGCPVLAFFARAGNDAADTTFVACNPVAHAFQVPALCKVRKGRGTHYVFGASEVKSLGYPPMSG